MVTEMGQRGAAMVTAGVAAQVVKVNVQVSATERVPLSVFALGPRPRDPEHVSDYENLIKGATCLPVVHSGTPCNHLALSDPSGALGLLISPVPMFRWRKRLAIIRLSPICGVGVVPSVVVVRGNAVGARADIEDNQ